MNNQELLQILSRLSQGIDPDSNQKFSDDHVLNKPVVIRALYSAVMAVKETNRNWSIAEESMLLKYFYSEVEISNIAVELGKSTESIVLKLIELEVSDELKVA